MFALAVWVRVVSRDVSPHNFDGLAMSGLAFSVAPCTQHSEGRFGGGLDTRVWTAMLFNKIIRFEKRCNSELATNADFQAFSSPNCIFALRIREGKLQIGRKLRKR